MRSLLSAAVRHRMSTVTDSTFFVFEDIENDDVVLSIYGDSLTFWLSIGGVVKDSVTILSENKKVYLKGLISPSIFCKAVHERPDLFDISKVECGFRIRATYVNKVSLLGGGK